jgi:hypothetical protein
MRCLFVLMMVNCSLLLAFSAGAQVSLDSKDVPKVSPADLPVPVKSSAGKWGYQDKSGTFIVPPQFDRAERFSEGLAVVQLKDKFGYIDPNGRLVIPVKFAHVEPFSEGLALVYTTWGMNILGAQEGYTFFVRAGYIDHSGKFVIKPRYVENAHSFSQGLAAFKAGTNYSYGKAKWGYLDKEGKWAIKPQFDTAGNFAEGLAPVAVFLDKKSNREKWGYIDQAGKLQIPAEFDDAREFKQGIARVFLAEKDPKFEHMRHPHGQWGWRCIDREGEFVACAAKPAPHQETSE